MRYNSKNNKETFYIEKVCYGKTESYDEWSEYEDVSDEDARLFGERPTYEEIYAILMRLLNNNHKLIEEVLQQAGIMKDAGINVEKEFKLKIRHLTAILKDRKINTEIPNEFKPGYTPWRDPRTYKDRSGGIGR